MISSFAGVATQHSHILHAAFEAAIRHSMMMAYARSAKESRLPHEPDFVAALVLDGSPIIGKYLNTICTAAGGSAKLSGIYCHGKPEIEYSGTGCELGDVLFAHFHTDAVGQTSSNALLLQAKMSTSLRYPVPTKEQHQLNLYLSWPQFSYKRTSPLLNGQRRDVNPKLPHHGAKYLLIDDSPPTDPYSGL